MIVSKQLAKNYKNRLNWVVVIVRQSWRVFSTTVYIYECPSGTSFAFVYSCRWVKSSSYVTALKFRSSISRVRSVVETRSQRQNSTQSTRESFGNIRFIVRREINFAKVKSHHFRRTKCLDSVALDILNVRRDSHRSAKHFAISFVKSMSFESRKLSRRENSLRRAHSDRARADIADCWWTLCKKISRREVWEPLDHPPPIPLVIT